MGGGVVSDPLDDLETAANLIPAAAAGVKLGDQARQKLERFNDVARQQRRLKASIELAVLLDGSNDAQLKTQITRALEAAGEASEAMCDVDDERSLTDAVNEYQAFGQSLGTLEVAIRPLWTRMIEQQFSPLSSVGALLRAFPNASDLGRRMVETAAAAQRHAQSPVVDLPAAVAELNALRNDLLLEQQAVAGDPKVSAFLQALADDRATLDLLYEEVLEWLGDQGALSKLKVSPA
jgi:hypothetical protein